MVEPVHGESEAEPALIRGLRWAILSSIVILAIEAAGAALSHSLSLSVDAVHNVPDILAFAAAWGALRGIQGGTSHDYTFGSHRFEVFAGLFNAALVLVVGLTFAGEALLTLAAHGPFAGAVTPLWIAATVVPTFALRTTNLFVLRTVPGRARDLNLRGVLVHLASDLVITSALLVVAGALFLDPSAWWVDPAVAVGIGAILVGESVPLFRAGWDVLTERTPGGVSIPEVAAAVRSTAAVRDVHDIHVWAVCPTLVCMSAHVRVTEMSVRESMGVVSDLRRTMEERFGIVHAVFEVEVAPLPSSGGAAP
jgi:cobalt-zinc-cadmium efflux system protein